MSQISGLTLVTRERLQFSGRLALSLRFVSACLFNTEAKMLFRTRESFTGDA